MTDEIVDVDLGNSKGEDDDLRVLVGMVEEEEEEDHMNQVMLWGDINPPENLNLEMGVSLDMDMDMYGPESSSSSSMAPPSSADASLSIGQIEEFLLNDDHDHDDSHNLLSADDQDFLSDILLDLPLPLVDPHGPSTTTSSSDNNLSSSPDIVSLQQHYSPPFSHDSQPEGAKDSCQRQESQQPSSPESEPQLEDDGDDPITKKRKR